MILIAGLVIVVVIVFLIIKFNQGNPAVTAAEDESLIHGFKAQTSRARLEEKTNNARMSNVETQRQLEEERMRTEQVTLEATRTAAIEAAAMGIDLETYRALKNGEYQLNAQLWTIWYQTEQDIRKQKEIDRNEIDSGLYLKEQEKKLLKEGKDEAEDKLDADDNGDKAGASET